MALFRRNKSQNSDVPADLQQYYSTGGSGVSTWLKRVALFVVVLAVLVGAGVWLFNALSNRSNQPASGQTAQQQQRTEEQRKAAEAKAKADAAAKKAAEEARKKADEAKKKAEEEAKKRAAANSTPAPTQTTPAPSQTTPRQTNPNPAPTAQNPQPATTAQLPNSGPGTLIAAIFAGASVVGAAAHALFAQRRAART